MYKEELLETLKEELTNENAIEKIIVFYQNGEKLQIGSAGKENEVSEVELLKETTSNDQGTNTYTNCDSDNNKFEALENAIPNATISQMIYLPTGRKINVIN
ncbi:hypothetical protein [Desulfosporosinus nitroreducens]|uniref:hypothetical protein n=1 Tax=Desulfosporosinus nitroreducens TaxID=2018668 RepID=UPI00207CE2C8|nr:hypothetical protein [Desulfosporosinus nitroreducens]MCO1602437.1 hypothetical protein [Desulfosporosinus nitroreducens]